MSHAQICLPVRLLRQRVVAKSLTGKEIPIRMPVRSLTGKAFRSSKTLGSLPVRLSGSEASSMPYR